LLVINSNQAEHNWALGDTSQIHGYLIHSLRFKDSKTTTTFWQLQGTIVALLHSSSDLQVVVAIVHPTMTADASNLLSPLSNPNKVGE
jgi:hypothetical protein